MAPPHDAAVSECALSAFARVDAAQRAQGVPLLGLRLSSGRIMVAACASAPSMVSEALSYLPAGVAVVGVLRECAAPVASTTPLASPRGSAASATAAAASATPVATSAASSSEGASAAATSLEIELGPDGKPYWSGQVPPTASSGALSPSAGALAAAVPVLSSEAFLSECSVDGVALWCAEWKWLASTAWASPDAGEVTLVGASAGADASASAPGDDDVPTTVVQRMRFLRSAQQLRAYFTTSTSGASGADAGVLVGSVGHRSPAFAMCSLALGRTSGRMDGVSLVRQRVAHECVGAQAMGAKAGMPEALRSACYWPSLLQLPIAVLLLPESSTAAVALRERVHKALCLPSVPLLRGCNELRLQSGTPRDWLAVVHVSGDDKHITDLHTIVPQPVGGAKLRFHMVTGHYQYFHYNEDGADDKGWGCAYRSLQTLASWIRFQGLSSAPVPDHATVQKTLVMLGDKEPSFYGSRQWIGAVEVSYVLDELFGVSSRILSVSSGSDVASRVHEIAAHFDACGAPVMIGGGVLAYTLLGVAVDPAGVAAPRFLILDPHYVGKNDASSIVRSKWCAWHDASLFRADAFYNFCMPMPAAAV